MESSAQVPLADITEPNWLIQNGIGVEEDVQKTFPWRLPARQAVLCRNWRCWRQSYGSSRQTFNIRKV